MWKHFLLTSALLFVVSLLFILLVFNIWDRAPQSNRAAHDSSGYYWGSNKLALFSPLTALSPPNIPATRLSPEEVAEVQRDIYGGKGDPAHLGGFTEMDTMNLSNNSFDFMFGPLNIKSVIDVGCGKGISTTYFRQRGARTLCVEGSHDAVQQSWLPADLIVEHDFTKGPWWPSETFDAVWCVEFLEHVSRRFMPNYIPIFQKAAMLFVTGGAMGGWHHVEVHEHWWWQARLEGLGFVYSKEISQAFRRYAVDGESYASENQNLWFTMVFINPAVMSLKQHQHVIGGWGCLKRAVGGRDGGLDCGKEAKPHPERNPPPEYLPLLDCSLDVKRPRLIWNCQKNNKAVLRAGASPADVLAQQLNPFSL